MQKSHIFQFCHFIIYFKQEVVMANATSLNSFIPLQKIGEGSFSSVYKVKRISDQQIYALKKVKIAYLKQKQKANALNEIRILASLSSAYIVSYKQAFFDEKLNLLCIVMEWANGGDLLQEVNEHREKKRRFPEEQIWKAAYQVISGLFILHRNCILHRDIKSANIFISNGSYKLGDLNVSKVNDHQQKLVQTQTGTPFYASPQIWRDQPYGNESDIWSFGCIIYEMCCWKPPFNGKDLNELYKNVQKGQFQAIPNIYSRELQKLIRSCLSQKAKDRPRAQELLKAGGVILTRCQFYEIEIDRKTVEANDTLLRTIKMPNDMKKLNSKLPEPKYQKEFEESKTKTLIKVHSSYMNQPRKYIYHNMPNNHSQVLQPHKESQSRQKLVQKPYKISQKIEVQNKSYGIEQRGERSSRVLKSKELSKKLLDCLTPIKEYQNKRKRPTSCNYLNANQKKQDKKSYFIKDLHKYASPPSKIYNSDRKPLMKIMDQRQLVSDRKKFIDEIRDSYRLESMDKSKNRCRSANHQQSALEIFNDLKRRLQIKYSQLQPSITSCHSHSDRNLIKYKANMKSQASLHNPTINYSYGTPDSIVYNNPMAIKHSAKTSKNDSKYLEQVHKKIMSTKLREKRSQPLLQSKRPYMPGQPQLRRLVKGSNFNCKSYHKL